MADLEPKQHPSWTRVLFGLLTIVNLVPLAFVIYMMEPGLGNALALSAAAPLVAAVGFIGARRRWHPGLLLVAGIVAAGWPAVLVWALTKWPTC